MELEGQEIVYVARFPSLHAVSVDLHVGSRLPAFCTAAGRAIHLADGLGRCAGAVEGAAPNRHDALQPHRSRQMEVVLHRLVPQLLKTVAALNKALRYFQERGRKQRDSSFG